MASLIAVAHALLLGFTCTCAFIFALLGVEGVADRDVQTVATASCFLHTVEESTILSYILYATLEHKCPNLYQITIRISDITGTLSPRLCGGRENGGGTIRERMLVFFIDISEGEHIECQF